jgi:hypothetical protein
MRNAAVGASAVAGNAAYVRYRSNGGSSLRVNLASAQHAMPFVQRMPH